MGENTTHKKKRVGQNSPKQSKKEKRSPKHKYTPELFAAILDGIADDKPLETICKTLGLSTKTFYKWLDTSEENRKEYARAKELQAERWEEKLLQIAGDTSDDELFTEDGRRVQNSEFINRSRLKVDTLKWIMSKRLPKKYGERIQQEVEHSGGINLKIQREIVHKQADD